MWTFRPCLAAAAVLAVVSPAGALFDRETRGGFIASCVDQEKCIKWEVTRLAGKSCGINVESCPVRVCLVFDTENDDCPKAGDAVSHACDNANKTGCVRPKEWWKGGRDAEAKESRGSNCDPQDDYEDPIGWENKCEGVMDEVKLCQVGKANDTLYWNMYVWWPCPSSGPRERQACFFLWLVSFPVAHATSPASMCFCPIHFAVRMAV
jgi:hypothetical protein